MADNVAISAGSGTTIATDDTGAGGHVQIVKLAISTDGSVTFIPADATNGIRVAPSLRQVRIAPTAPTISTSPAYSVGDQVGGVMTFTSAALSSGGTGTIFSAIVTARWANTIVPDIDLFLFEVSPTLVGSDNAAFDITDANLETARVIGVIEFKSTDWQILANNLVCAGTVNGGQPAVPFVTSGSANIFGVMCTRTAFTAASTTDLVVALRIAQD